MPSVLGAQQSLRFATLAPFAARCGSMRPAAINEICHAIISSTEKKFLAHYHQLTSIDLGGVSTVL
jgi:hypothetical protein